MSTDEYFCTSSHGVGCRARLSVDVDHAARARAIGPRARRHLVRRVHQRARDLGASRLRDGQGTDVNFEDDLGLDSSTTILRLGGHWWMSRRNRLDFSVFSFSREGNRQIDETIEFGDTTFNINTVVNRRRTSTS